MATKKNPSRVGGNYVYRKPNVSFDFEIEELPWTRKQQDLIQTLQNKKTKCALIKGPAGSSKTILAIYAGLQLLKHKKISDITYVRSAVESGSSKLGFLPGDINDKFSVYATPLQEKLEELLSPQAIKMLNVGQYVKAIPINYMRGLNFSGRLIILDESQNFTSDELVTAITRLGENSRIWIMGDPNQSDLRGKRRNDFVSFCHKLNDEECKNNGIESFEFGVEDIVRSEFCKFIVEKLEIYEFSTTNIPPQVGDWSPSNE
jgi:phosphate starvation-inducible PhoH-like protein